MMHRLVLAGSTLAAFGLLAQALVPFAHAASMADELARLRWAARPIVILSDSPDDPRVARQIAVLDRETSGVDERQIKVLREARPGSPLRKRLGLEASGFAVVLVGKDGGVKEVWHEPVDPKRIFAIIDAMPMRQREMRD